jgi:hypothetical protein
MRRTSVGLLFGVSVVAGCLPDIPTDRLQRSYVDNSESAQAGPSGTGAGGGYVAPVVPPEFGPTVRQADPPPPLSGGTLAVAPDGKTVVAADPDRDRVYIVDVDDPSKRITVALSLHDEPGRVVVDGSNRAHVVLRGGGAFVTIDLANGAIRMRRAVCSAPRGIAYDGVRDLVHVACAAGELVTFPAAAGPESMRRMLVRDLRDVVVVPGALVVSTFRDARTYRVPDDTDEMQERSRLESPTYGTPAVAWRMSALPPRSDAPSYMGLDDIDDVLVAAQQVPASGDDGSVVQRPPPPQSPIAYYSDEDLAPCTANGPRPLILERNYAITVPEATLPVDAAATSDLVAVVAAANGHTPSLTQLVLVPRHSERAPLGGLNECRQLNPGLALAHLQATSVAFLSATTAVVLSREPAALAVVDVGTLGYGAKEITRISLAAESREDTGHAIFHANSGYNVACASCHPDGADDGHSWRSLDLGPRRTPSLRGTLAGTAPYHWNGEAADMNALMKLTFETRMHGPTLSDDRLPAVAGWLTALRAPPSVKPADTDAAAAVARGKTLIEGDARCSTCHAGPMHTNNATVDVGTGGAFQVPSLVGVSWRAPYTHDGSVPTVRSLLEHTHGGAPLSMPQKSDLEAYVGTL